ncbi:DHA1 family inner membrane transport protein [Thermocatellispora tengchongensis]|uniref:DHA1 family inner membrane transport protein n=1 Tax=Thermocatellispora tengchongensis TaxID=1073253 RepID=A0A840P4H4_9ACTN|nr:MFS transporter [Thermocatellispora tengchongensis]MBB5130945.1 DHA1 family inner membrane transport protein [Thermocatellispora tengchongensis]
MLLLVFSLMIMVFGLTTGEFVIAGILPDVARDLSVSIPAAGLLVSAYAAGMIVGGPVITTLTARLPRRPLIAGLIVTSIAGNAASALAPTYPILLAARFVAGLVVATFFAVAIATAVSTALPGKQGSTVARLTLGMNLGIIAGTPLGTFIGHNLGWRATFAAIAVFSAAALVLVLRSVPGEPAPEIGSLLGELRVFTRRDVALAIALTAVGNLGVVTVFSFLAPLAIDVSGFSDGTLPVLLLVYGTGAVAGNFLGGRLADKALMPSLAGLLAVLAGVLAVGWAVGGHQVSAAVLWFVLGVLAFAIIPGMQTRVLTTAQAAPTLAVAVNASGFQLAAAFAGWLGGRLIDGPGPRSIYLVAAVLTVAGLLIALYSLRRDRLRSARPGVGAGRTVS